MDRLPSARSVFGCFFFWASTTFHLKPGFLHRRVGPQYGSKSQREADKVEHQQQFDFLPSELCSLTLGKNGATTQREERIGRRRDPNTTTVLLPAFLSLIISPRQRKGGMTNIICLVWKPDSSAFSSEICLTHPTSSGKPKLSQLSR